MEATGSQVPNPPCLVVQIQVPSCLSFPSGQTLEEIIPGNETKWAALGLFKPQLITNAQCHKHLSQLFPSFLTKSLQRTNRLYIGLEQIYFFPWSLLSSNEQFVIYVSLKSNKNLAIVIKIKNPPKIKSSLNKYVF